MGETTYSFESSEDVAFTTSSAGNTTAAPLEAGAPGEKFRTYRLTSSATCRIWVGVGVNAAAPPANDDGVPLPASPHVEYVDVPLGARISALGDTGSGTLTATLCRKR